jgi:hypothetical protein
MPPLPSALILVFASLAGATPLEPVLVGPEDGALVSSPVRLEVWVEDSESTPLDVEFELRPAVPEEAWEGFSVAALPDTQFLVYEGAGAHVEAFEAQTRWIAEQQEEEGLVFATHLGDVVQTWDDTAEWERALGAMELLGEVPHGIALGNHDCDFPAPELQPRPECIFDDYFPAERYEDEPWWGDSYDWDGGYSSYQLVSAGGLDLLFLHLSFEAWGEEVAWAQGVIDAHSDRLVILSTHWFLDPQGELAGGEGTGASLLWDELVAPFPNVWFVLSAHVPGEAVRSEDVAGHPVHQLLACYQTIDELISNDGYFRLMRFEPALGRVRVETYSALLDAWMTDEDSAFELDWPIFPYQRFTLESVASGQSAWLEQALEPGSYEWYVVARDGEGVERASALWRFTVEGGPADTGEPDSGHPPKDSGDPAEDSGGGEDTAREDDEPDDEGCGGCAAPGRFAGLGLLGLLALGLVRRERG